MRAKAPAPAKPPPPPSLDERAAALKEAMATLELQRWPTTSVTVKPLSGVEVRVTTSGPPGRWWLRTQGLFPHVPHEVTFAVPRTKDDTEAPAWAFSVVERLIELARRGVVAAGQIAQWATPFGAISTDLTAFALVVDPHFGVVNTRFDTVPVLLALGITRDEVALVREWSPDGLFEVYRRLDPTGATDLDRVSLLSSPRARQAIEQRVSREGSSMSALDASTSELTPSGAWRVDVATAEALLSLLKGRIGHQRPFSVRAPALTVDVQPSDRAAFSVEGPRATLKLTQPAARAMRSTLKPTPGTFTWEALPGLVLEVTSS